MSFRPSLLGFAMALSTTMTLAADVTLTPPSGGIISGSGYSVSRTANQYTVNFTPALAGVPISLLMDARANNGRSLGMGATTTAASAVLAVTWLEATENVASICFLAAR